MQLTEPPCSDKIPHPNPLPFQGRGNKPPRALSSLLKHHRARLVTFLLVILLAALSAYAMFRATESGIGLSTDSLRYLNVSRSLLRGEGLVISREKANEPLTHFAPLYPVAIAAVSKLTGEQPEDSARWLQVVLMPANVLLIAWLTFLATRGSPPLTVLGAAVAAAASALVQVHRYALSEALFLFAQTAAIALLMAFLMRRHRAWLIAAAVFAAAALLTRYAGVALIASSVFTLILLREGALRRRMLDALIFAIVALAIPAVWVIRNVYAADTMANREIEFHLLSETHINSALSTFAAWLLPNGLPVSLNHHLLGMITAFIVLGLLRQRSGKSVDATSNVRTSSLDAPTQSLTVASAAIYACTYAAMLILSISFVDYYTPLDNRILSPLYPVGLVCAAWLFQRMQQRETAGVRRTVTVVAIVLFAGQVVRGGMLYYDTNRESAGFSNKRWNDSRLLARLATYPQDTPLYSNAPDVITLMTGRKALRLPAQYDATTGVAYDDFAEDIQAFRTRFRGDENAILVYFRRVKRPYLPSEGYLRKRIVLRTVYNTAEGAIYKRAALSTTPGALKPR